MRCCWLPSASSGLVARVSIWGGVSNVRSGIDVTTSVPGRALLVCALALVAVRSLAASAPAPPATEPASVIALLDACVARLDRDVDVGFDRIAARCPDLPGALARS